jgi:hypothetical protein
MFSKFFKNKDEAPFYEERRIFDEEEGKFFGRLIRAVPNCYIFPNLDARALLKPVAPNQKQKIAALQELEGRKVDFAIFNSAMSLLCVIELATPPAPDGTTPKSNIGLFKTAGISTIKWDRNNLPNFEQILRILAPYSTLQAPITDVAASTIMQAEMIDTTQSPDTVRAIFASDPVSSNIIGMPLPLLESLVPNKYLKTAYPHVWGRIVLFSSEPKHLKKYLATLSVQNRGEVRVGFPIEVLNEIATINAENERYLARSEPKSPWQPNIVNI